MLTDPSRREKSLRRPGALIAALSVAILLAFTFACSSDDGTPNRIVGVITEVRLEGQDVASIRLRDADDRTWDLPVDFDPGSEVPGYHLEEHRAQRLPVVVRVRESDNGLYASEINDVDPHQ